MKRTTWFLLLLCLTLSPAMAWATKLTWSQTDTLVFPATKRLTATYADIDTLSGTVTFYAGSRLTVTYIDPDTIAGSTRATVGSTWTFPAGSRITATYADIDTLNGNVVIPAGATWTIQAGSQVDATYVSADTIGGNTRGTVGATWTLPAGSRLTAAYIDADSLIGSLVVPAGAVWTVQAGSQIVSAYVDADTLFGNMVVPAGATVTIQAGSRLDATYTDTDSLIVNTIATFDGITSVDPDLFTLDMPSGSIAGGAHRVVVGTLYDQGTCWNREEFHQLSKNTSWYKELGPFPDRYMIRISATQDSVIIHNLLDNSQWMVISNGFTLDVRDICFLDGKLYMGDYGNGIARWDFSNDKTHTFHAGAGMYEGKTPIATLRTTWSALLLAGNPQPVNSSITAIAVIRDPEGSIEADTGRPQHIVAVATAGGISVSDAGISALYDSNITGSWLDVQMLPSGDMVAINSDVTRDNVHWRYSVQSISADSWTFDEVITNNGSGSEDLPWSNAAVFSMGKAIPVASVADGVSPVAIFGSDEGLAISHVKRDDNTDGLTFIVNAVGNWPPYSGSGSKMYSLALEDATELFGRTVTNTNAVTFVAGVVGSGANFVAASSQSLSLADHADLTFTTLFSMGCWFKRDIDSGAIEGLVSKWDNDAAADQSFQLSVGATDLPTFKTATAGPAVITSIGPAISLATWYHLVGTYDGTTQKLYLNGELVDSDAQTGNMIDSAEKLFVGAGSATDAATQFFDGIIDDVFIMDRVLSAAEIRFLYQRGLSATQSPVDPNDCLHAVDVDYIAVDPLGKYIAAGNQDSVSIIDRWGIPVARYGTPGGAMDDVAVLSYAGSDSFAVYLGGATAITPAQPDIDVLSGGNETLKAMWKPLIYSPTILGPSTATPSGWAVVDSAGYGHFTQVDQAIDAGFKNIFIAPGTYEEFTADVNNLIIRGSGRNTVITDGAVTAIAITVTADDIEISDLAARTLTGGTGGNVAAISVSNASTGCVFDKVWILSSDTVGFDIDGPLTRIENCDIDDCDTYGVNIADEGDGCSLLDSKISDSGTASFLIDINGEDCIVDGLKSDGAGTDNSGTSTVGDVEATAFND